MAPAQPKSRKAQATRKRQLDAAELLFARKGYFDTAIADITQAADVALGTFYVYFPSKLAIFQELVRQLNHNLRMHLRKALTGLTRRTEIERRGFQAFFDFVSEHTNLYSIVSQAELVDPELYRWYYRSLAESYTRGLAQAARRGEVKNLDPEALAWCLMGIAHFLGMRWTLWSGQPVPKRQFETVLEFIHSGIFKPQRPTELPVRVGPARKAGAGPVVSAVRPFQKKKGKP
jgi:AcrR family transcriptional regulator